MVGWTGSYFNLKLKNLKAFHGDTVAGHGSIHAYSKSQRRGHMVGIDAWDGFIHDINLYGQLQQAGTTRVQATVYTYIHI